MVVILKKILKRIFLPKSPDERLFLEQHLSHFAKRNSNKLVLDVGAGECQYAYLFNKRNEYESCDMQDSFHSDVEYDIVSSIYDIPRNDSSYDIVLMLQVLEHIEFPVKALKEINRILKKGGVLFLSVPQAAGDHFAPYHYFNYTQYGLDSVLKRAGFEIMSMDRLEGMFVYVGNRIQKLGAIIYYQNLDKNYFCKMLCLLFMSVCFWMGFALSMLNSLDKQKQYCIGIIAVCRKNIKC
ncbi:MAG: class I SAM-dependent methyltransferase [Lentimicrobiaceae bacterium]|jgi:SAM-dependent methyltransferase|nr:class I SAM-dependent methyltransferase [Candidatus Scalindua sp.]MBT6671594.1 class I SAM-dependent methyltransferase [Lentimicrobiaceae bacterium]